MLGSQGFDSPVTVKVRTPNLLLSRTLSKMKWDLSQFSGLSSFTCDLGETSESWQEPGTYP